ncbi:hypothetical protein AVHM3334_02025 [Acidovorax sp. SUPP3334]|nr:hypothetical protein AVHM3334_02025 [Acidovorax sp. SUPP3334]
MVPPSRSSRRWGYRADDDRIKGRWRLPLMEPVTAH